MGVFDFLNRKSANNDLQAVLTPEKQENLLSQFLPDDPDKRSQLARALIMGGASALQAGGPSVGRPTNLLSVLGSGLAGGVKAYSDAELSDLEAQKVSAANRVNNAKLQQYGDNQARAKAFFAKYGSPGQGGYSPEALAELMQVQLLNGDEEGARKTQEQLQKLQQHAADSGMVFDPKSGGFALAPGFGQSLFDTEKAKGLGKAIGSNAETTADIKNYEYGVQKPGFVDYQTEQKKAGVANPDDSFGKKANELAATRFNDIAQQGPQAQEMVGNVKTLTELGKSIGTGKWAQVKAAWGPWAKGMGVDVDGLDEIQAFDSLVSRTAPSLRVPGSGATSDFDASQFLKSIPSLGNTPEGNELIGATMNAVGSNKIKAAEIANKVMRKEITWQEGDQQIAALPDPFTAFREYKAASDKAGKTGTVTKSPSGDSEKSTAAPKTSRVAVVNSEADYNALPSGSPYRFSDETTVRTKP
jgi:hypothetical protein